MSRDFLKKHARLTPVLIAVLAALAVLAAATGTAAWLRHARSLSTIAKIQVPSLTLTGKEGGNSIPLELGNLDFSSDGSAESVFRIDSITGTKYIVQLAHTTNLPLSYKIFQLSDADGDGTRTALTGKYLNQADNRNLADPSLHAATYDNYGNVQENAEPLYWQSSPLVSNGTDYYVLVVSWTANENGNNKETDMIYITAGIGGNYEEAAA